MQFNDQSYILSIFEQLELPEHWAIFVTELHFFINPIYHINLMKDNIYFDNLKLGRICIL